MLSKNKTKLITSLAKKKSREKHGLFVAEGDRLVKELLKAGLSCRLLIATEEWQSESEYAQEKVAEIVSVDLDELKQVSQLVTPASVIGVFEWFERKWDASYYQEGLVLYLDQIQDPGNLGTIIRIADWFGISAVVCGKGTVDLYSSKVVQATMGAIAAVKVFYVDEGEFFQVASEKTIPVFGTFMEGGDIYATQLSRNGIVVLGNEGNGISPSVEKYIKNKLKIPDFNANKASESLNVATATAVVCSEFKRRGLHP